MVLLSKAIIHSFSQNKLQYEHACIFLITKMILCFSYSRKSLKIPNGVLRTRNSKKDKQHNGQKKKDKQRSTKHCTEH